MQRPVLAYSSDAPVAISIGGTVRQGADCRSISQFGNWEYAFAAAASAASPGDIKCCVASSRPHQSRLPLSLIHI